MLDLKDKDLQRYKDLAKGLAGQQARAGSPPPQPALPGHCPATSGNCHISTPIPLETFPQQAGSDPELLTRFAQGTDIEKLLGGYDNFTGHGKEIKLYYLIGRCYHQGALSGRQIVKMIDGLHIGLLEDDLATRVRKSLKIRRRELFNAIPKLESLLKTQLITRLGEGLPNVGLTEAGELFWRLIADHLRKYL